MNLKEAFRFQNKLQSLMEEAQSILGNEDNITRVQNTYLRKKVMKQFEDETTEVVPSTEYSGQITSVAEFLLYLLRERELLTAAVCRAKSRLDLPEGNQVSYRCDVKRVTTINFDRNRIRKMCAELSRKADAVSSALDAALVTTQVDYAAPFDVNDTFAEAFGVFTGEAD